MKLLITKRAQKELSKIPNAPAKNVVNKIKLLSKNTHPTNSKKLQGNNNYRLRVGVFRVIYTTDRKKKEITILRIADRKKIYR